MPLKKFGTRRNAIALLTEHSLKLEYNIMYTSAALTSTKREKCWTEYRRADPGSVKRLYIQMEVSVEDQRR